MMSIHTFPRKQGGAALIVGLLLLMVLTLISLSALKNTRQQQQMSANNQFQIRTFAAAESAVRDVLNEVRYLREAPEDEAYILLQAIRNAEDLVDGPSRALDTFDGFATSAELTYRGTAPAPGSTQNLGTGRGYVVHEFDIDGRAELDPDDPVARALHRQGIGQIGPQ